MKTVEVLIEEENGKLCKRSLANASLICPFCEITIIPTYSYAIYDEYTRKMNVFSQCTDDYCRNTFITEFYENGEFYGVKSSALPMLRKFSEVLMDLSPNFVEIYNQAYSAEQLGLDQICGVGYRKALEFLIKDYLISISSKKQHEAIKMKFLNNCIKNDIENENIKKVATRAVWLGNDETHYTRKWRDKDVHDLKALIALTIHWIESEIQTKELLKDMPEFK